MEFLSAPSFFNRQKELKKHCLKKIKKDSHMNAVNAFGSLHIVWAGCIQEKQTELYGKAGSYSPNKSEM